MHLNLEGKGHRLSIEPVHASTFTNSTTSRDSMNKFTLSNVPVEFPFVPYPCQVVYMEKVIQALQQARHIKLNELGCCCYLYVHLQGQFVRCY